MASPTNLTDRISHLRDRRDDSPVGGDGGPQRVAPATKYERQRATDYFMIFAYALLGVALAAQVGLIVLLEILQSIWL